MVYYGGYYLHKSGLNMLKIKNIYTGISITLTVMNHIEKKQPNGRKEQMNWKLN